MCNPTCRNLLRLIASLLPADEGGHGFDNVTVGDLSHPEDHLPGLPLGTRGGMSTSYPFAQDGEYEIQGLLALWKDS